MDIASAPTQAQVDKYYYLSGMLKSALNEMREFAKKKPDGIVSETKITLLNRLLAEIKTVVQMEASNAYLDMLSEQDLPQNSDAVLILGQYDAALKSFEERHHRYENHAKRWVTQEWLTAQAELQEEEQEEEYDVDEDDWEDEGNNEDEADDDQ